MFHEELNQILEIYQTDAAIPLAKNLQTVIHPGKTSEITVYNHNGDALYGSITLMNQPYRLVFQPADVALANLMGTSTAKWRNGLYYPLKTYLKSDMEKPFDDKDYNYCHTMSAIYADVDKGGDASPVIQDACVVVGYENNKPQAACFYASRAYWGNFKATEYGWKARIA